MTNDENIILKTQIIKLKHHIKILKDMHKKDDALINNLKIENFGLKEKINIILDMESKEEKRKQRLGI
jgi:hypothetical protein